MNDYGIVDQTSVILFLSSLIAETGGKYTTEQDFGYSSYWDSKEYGYEHRGAGYIQVTGSDLQSDFLKHIQKNPPDGTDIPGYIGSNYALEAAAWWWSVNEQTGWGNVNNYISMAVAPNLGSSYDSLVLSQYWVQRGGPQ